MPEKKTSNMLIRAIPMDVWERINTLCRRRGIKRREFLEQALALFEGGENEQKAERARQAKLQVDQIMEALKGYEGLINLKKKIDNVYKNIEMIGDRDNEMNILLEVKKLEENLNEIIKVYVPKHEIPEDTEELRKMGLGEYSYVDIPLDYKRDDSYIPPDPSSSETENDVLIQERIKEVKEGIDEMREKEKEGLSEREKPKDKEEDDGKTSVFGRGFEGYDKD